MVVYVPQSPRCQLLSPLVLLQLVVLVGDPKPLPGTWIQGSFSLEWVFQRIGRKCVLALAVFSYCILAKKLWNISFVGASFSLFQVFFFSILGIGEEERKNKGGEKRGWEGGEGGEGRGENRKGEEGMWRRG